jgi:hypothetical protein
MGSLPCAGEDAPTKAGQAEALIKRLLSEANPKEAAESLVQIGLASVTPLCKAREREEDADRVKRIEEVLESLAGKEEVFNLPPRLTDPSTKATVKLERADKLLFPGISDDARRICLALKNEKDEKPPKVIVIDREEEKIISLIEGEQPRFSSDGKTVAFLRPLGDDVHFYKTFYTSTASAFYPDTRKAFDLDPGCRDNHANLTLSADGRRAAFQSRMQCYVHVMQKGAPPIAKHAGRLPALSPDGKWLAGQEESGRIFLASVDGAAPKRGTGPLEEGSEIREVRALNRGIGVVFIATLRMKKAKSAYLWGFRPETGARGVIAAVKGCKDLSVAGDNRILFRTSAILTKKGYAGKLEKVASRGDSAYLSLGGRFVVYLKGRTLRTVFVGWEE